MWCSRAIVGCLVCHQAAVCHHTLLSLCSIALCKFAGHGDQQFILVGTGKELILNPRSHSGGAIHCYKLSNDKLELVHKTPVDEVPGAICPFQGRVLISVGRFLRIYDLGKKKMLRKCENKVCLPSACCDLLVLMIRHCYILNGLHVSRPFQTM